MHSEKRENRFYSLNEDHFNQEQSMNWNTGYFKKWTKERPEKTVFSFVATCLSHLG